MVTKQDILDNKDKFKNRIINRKNDDCIYFKGYHNKLGYVAFQFCTNGIKKQIEAHRASYIINTDEELNVDDIIIHFCDNPSCINIKHLSKGTHNNNVQDRVNKGRSAVGKNNGRYIHGHNSKYDFVKKPEPEFQSLYNRKLSIKEVIRVKELIKEKFYSLTKIAKIFNVKNTVIRDISSGRTYFNVEKTTTNYK